MQVWPKIRVFMPPENLDGVKSYFISGQISTRVKTGQLFMGYVVLSTQGLVTGAASIFGLPVPGYCTSVLSSGLMSWFQTILHNNLVYCGCEYS